MKAVAILLLCVFPLAAEARRPESWRFSCGDLRALVQQNGAVVIATGPDLYDRFVAHGGYCMFGEVTVPAYVPARDRELCQVGYVCRDRDSGGGIYVAPARVLTCPEGAREVFLEPGSYGGYQPMTYTCQGGRWLRERRR
jgi:hypothetical protein